MNGYYVSAWNGAHIVARKYVIAQSRAAAKFRFLDAHPEWDGLSLTVEEDDHGSH